MYQSATTSELCLRYITSMLTTEISSNLSLDLGLLGRRCCATVARIKLWALPKFTLSPESQRL